MRKQPFLERLKENRPLLGDGAMGTLLHQRGAALNACFDALNLSDPAILEGIHRDYIAAGAELIETNTFGANRFKLAEYGLGDKVVEVNHAGVEIARRAIAESGREVTYIVGSVGPLGARMRPYGRIRPEEAHAAFAEQIGALADAGVDALIFETFTDHNELLDALQTAREVASQRTVGCAANGAGSRPKYARYLPDDVCT